MKIPQKAKLVFKGKIFDTYQWPVKGFDGSTIIYEMLRRPNTVEIIATKKNKILLAKQQQATTSTFYSFFGGRQDPGETPLQTAKRELMEESGMTSTDWELIKKQIPVGKIDWTIYTYIARDCEITSKQNLDSGEKISIEKFTFDEFIKISTSSKFQFRSKEFIEEYLKTDINKEKLREFKKKLF